MKPHEVNAKALSVFDKDTIIVPDLRALEVDLEWLKQDTQIMRSLHALFTSIFVEGGGDVSIKQTK